MNIFSELSFSDVREKIVTTCSHFERIIEIDIVVGILLQDNAFIYILILNWLHPPIRFIRYHTKLTPMCAWVHAIEISHHC